MSAAAETLKERLWTMFSDAYGSQARLQQCIDDVVAARLFVSNNHLISSIWEIFLGWCRESLPGDEIFVEVWSGFWNGSLEGW